MARDDPDELKLIIRRKRVPGGEGHSAAWKIAYADFVTAMMAFFLLLWLLNASMTVDLVELGNSFTPGDPLVEISATGNASNKGGSDNERIEGKVEDQKVVDNAFTLDDLVEEVAIEVNPHAKNLTSKEKALSGEVKKNEGDFTLPDIENELKRALRQLSSERPVDKVSTEIYIDHLGLNVEFINDDDQRSFRWDSAKMTRPLRNTLFAVSNILSRVDRQIMITGHSADESTYERNWELSMLRADITRQNLIRMGIPEQRIFGIGGKGARELINPEDPKAMENIRLQITLLAEDDHQVISRETRFSSPPKVSDN